MSTSPAPDDGVRLDLAVDARSDDLDIATAVAREAGRRLLEHRTEFVARVLGTQVLGNDALAAATSRAGTGELSRDDIRALKDTADAMSHNYIVERLAELRPGDAVLSEEGVDLADRDESERVWIVDPLDGTSEYGQRRADWAVHVALWERDTSAPTGGHLLAGVVELPAQGRTLTTGDAAIELPIPADRPIRFVSSRSRPPLMLDDVIAALEVLLAERGVTGQGVEILRVGSVGAKVAEIIAGRADVYLHDSGFYEWDLAAPLAVAHHYGIDARHLDGSDFELNQRPPFVRNSLFCTAALEPLVREAMS